MFKTADERLFAMGRNTFGQLGVFDQTSSSGQGLVQSNDKDEIFATRPFPVGSERYSNVGWRWIDPFAGRQIDSVHCAYDHTVVVSGNKVFTFGANRMGQLLKGVNVGTKNLTWLPEPIEAALFLGHAEAVSPQLTVKAWASGDSTFVQTLRQSCGPSSFSIDGFEPCLQCDAGKYEIRNSSRSCIPCSLGHYSAKGQTTCVVCSAGKYANMTGTSQCFTCPASRPGTFGEGATTERN